jgi:8-oxo-dGTP pyrophosphatase MutT (NUDIX family)
MALIKIINGIIDKSGKILLMHRKKFNEFTFPGGKNNISEPDKEALQREVYEELGIIASLDYKIGRYDFKGYNNKKYLREVYKINIISGCPIIKERDLFSKIIWSYPRESLGLNLAPKIKEAIEDYIKIIS